MAQDALSPDAGERLAAMRRQLAWLYNQLLGSSPAGRGLDATITDEIRATEATLQRLEWRVAPWLAELKVVLRSATAFVGDQRQISVVGGAAVALRRSAPGSLARC